MYARLSSSSEFSSVILTGVYITPRAQTPNPLLHEAHHLLAGHHHRENKRPFYNISYGNFSNCWLTQELPEYNLCRKNAESLLLQRTKVLLWHPLHHPGILWSLHHTDGAEMQTTTQFSKKEWERYWKGELLYIWHMWTSLFIYRL